MALPWFRMYAEAVDDEKLRLLAFEDRWHFVALLCCKCQGVFDCDDEQLLRRKLAVKLGLDLASLDEVRRRLNEVGLIDDRMEPLNWDKRQFRSDVSTNRVRKHREVKRFTAVSETDQIQNRTDTEQNREEYARERASDRFDEFWALYPRRVGKAAAKRAWSRKGLNAKADEILEHLRARVRSDAQWLAEGGKFIPHPQTWLNRDGWLDEYQVGSTNGAGEQSRKPSAVERAQRATGGGF